jgi:hypothetical protein
MPVTNVYRNRTRRQQMAEALQKFAMKGDLSALVTLVDNPDRRVADDEGFRRARAEYGGLAEQINWLRNGGLTRPAVVRVAAREASSIVSAVLATAVVLLITLNSVL